MLLFLVLAGCGEKEIVTVSGAVVNPGPYPFSKGWSSGQYLEAAGGYTQDALVSEARVNRSVPDTTNPELTRQLMWPMGRAPEMIAGDLIWVPQKTYQVRMDTVRVVRKLEINWNGNLYKVPEGYLVPGWTEAGVLTAVVLGRGAVVNPETEEVLGQFMYLHLSMNPDQYSSTITELGEVVIQREMLEDAVALQKVVMEKSVYRLEDKIERPPEGYVRVLAGVWPKPRTPTLPGPGMRKKDFSDGRAWTTYPDGRQRMVYPNGRVVMDFPAGGTETRYPDGKQEVVDASGNTSVTFPDGKQVVEYVDGSQETRHADGKLVQKFTTGTERTILRDGTERTTFRDGTLHVKKPGGKVEIRVPEGIREIKHADGRVVATTAEGHEVTVYPDGRRFTRTGAGVTLEEYADGRKIQKGSDGSRIEVYPNGNKQTIHQDGSESLERADGSRRDQLADGTVVEITTGGKRIQTNPKGIILEIYPDGREIQTDPNGSKLARYPDGRTLQTDAAGNSVEKMPDGMMIKTYVNAHRYWGQIHEGIVSIVSTPEEISPGDSIVVVGTAPDSVGQLMIAAFRLPDGVPIHARLLREGESFTATIADSLLAEEGYFRLQVQASLSQRAVVVADRMIKVGAPSELEEMILDVQPFRSSDDAEVRVYDMVNQARTDIGLAVVELDYELTEVAKALVWDAVATGSFTHGVRKKGAEKVARGPSVEEVHAYMMMSVGHRSIILDHRFTKFGVAVAEDRGQVWVVEVFER